jgi:SAM-dependent methyltransferase
MKNWDERVESHTQGNGKDFYDIEGFLAGKSTLRNIEIEELGNVSGKSMLHLQCHFGLDTLSWARQGAKITGVDFSPKAIEYAINLASRCKLSADFICSDVFNLPNVFDKQFDIVIATYGILCWIPEVHRYMNVVSHFLKAGGCFLLIDGHPFLDMFEFNEESGQLEIKHSYFHANQPEECYCTTSYANKKYKMRYDKTYQWSHDIDSIVTAITGNGMELLSLKEYAFAVYQKYPNMVQNEKGQWIFSDGNIGIPMLMSIIAKRKT